MGRSGRQRGGQLGDAGLPARDQASTMGGEFDGPQNRRWGVGSLVVVRSGCIFRIKGIFSASYKEGRSGNLSKLFGWTGVCLQHGNKTTWQDNGDYSPVYRGHELDVIGLATSASLAKIGFDKEGNPLAC